MPSLADLQRAYLLRQLGLTASNLTNADLEVLLYATTGGPASQRVFNAGRYYPAGGPQGPTTNPLNLSQLVLIPFECGEAAVFDRIAIEVTALGAGGTVRLGLYDSLDGNPNALKADAGTVDTSTNGGKEANINVATGPGLLWVAICAQGGVAPTIRADTAYHSPFVALNGGIPVASTYSSYVQTAAVAGALPAVVGAFTANAIAPKAFLRAA